MISTSWENRGPAMFFAVQHFTKSRRVQGLNFAITFGIGSMGLVYIPTFGVGKYTIFLMDPPWDLKQPIENQITIRKRLKMLGIYENWHPMSCLANIKVKMFGGM